jgi:LuxR family maltose regulon positive regulatory protein
MQAEDELGRALELLGIDSMVLLRAHALLLLAPVRHGRGDSSGAHSLVEQARELIKRFTDPGVLPALLEQTEQALGNTPHRPTGMAEPLTERELAVLRLLPSRLSTREIGRELYVSANTVRTHVRAIYRKVGVTSRATAVAHARQLRLLPQSTPTDRQPISSG